MTIRFCKLKLVILKRFCKIFIKEIAGNAIPILITTYNMQYLCRSVGRERGVIVIKDAKLCRRGRLFYFLYKFCGTSYYQSG